MINAIGYREYSFTDKQTGNEIRGGKLTVVYPIEGWDGYFSGSRCMDINIRDGSELQRRCKSIDFKIPVPAELYHSPSGQIIDVIFNGGK